MDDATWIVNGIEIGNGVELSRMIDDWEKKTRVLVLVLIPSGWEVPGFVPPDGEAYGRIWDLAERRKIVVIRIRPEDMHITDPQLTY